MQILSMLRLLRTTALGALFALAFATTQARSL
jgi:hypothetical protein